ncbi:MAG: aminoglycoside phosphotransferase family protein [Rhodobacteraceae bacterium]|jgi:hypothetical protein|nr:aminoglycoside phosphotransferase family protein [Paracoccaceae bacterium]
MPNARPAGLTPAEAAARLAALLAGRRGYEETRVLQVLRAAHDREVFLVRLSDGRKAVLKHYIGPNVAQLVRNVQAEFDFAAAAMGDGALQCVRCLAAEPDLGFVVLSHAPGKPLESLLLKADAARRRRLIRQAGAWLAAYTAPRRRVRRFAPSHWLGRCRARDASRLAGEDLALRAALDAALVQRMEAHTGGEVTHAATHADFVPRNLHFHQGTLIGLDIQGEAWFSVARDAATFLVWVAANCAPVPGGTRFGLPAADLDAFLDGGAVPPAETGTVLPFFIGIQFYNEMIDAQGKPERLDRLRAAVADYVAAPVAP